ncbi:hypothetical protein [Lysinibacillus xylanilyticus]|uniref:hypothetical protein n=1 Tax=Lysinibacillus xylanilyticus TaxID=582475 RepID=UPI00083CA50C|nr:hypothetical protein [Lysinibacillus xylanilyticus]
MAIQMKKYIAVTTASIMAMQLAACGNTETQTVEESSTTSTTSTTSANSHNFTEQSNTTTAGEDLQSVYDSDMANACDEWKENDDGSFECLDENSPHYAQHFFNGLMYASAGAMIGSAMYKSRNLKNGTNRKDKSQGLAVPRTTKTNTSESKNTKSNGITTNGSQKTSGTTSGSSNSSNSNTSGSKSYSSGKRSYSNSSGSSSNSTNSYSNHSSSSTGKSGFGSGGASRGGSSSS